MEKLLKFLKTEKGATAVEYGLIVSLVCISALVAMQGFGSSAINMWNNVSNEVVSNS